MPELGIAIFIIPGQRIKNGQDRVVVVNSIATEIIEEMRSVQPKYVVFSLRGKPVASMYGRAWKAARESVGLNQVRVHDLRLTFGRRLRTAGVSFEDRQDLLGHKSGRMTTHYSMPELSNLIAAANAVCGDESRKSHARKYL